MNQWQEQVSFRTITEQDWPEIARLARFAFEETNYKDMFPYDEVSFLRVLESGICQGVVMEAEGQIQGIYIACINPHPMNFSIMLSQEIGWWVAKEWRKDGVAMELLRQFEASCPQVDLFTAGSFSVGRHRAVTRLYKSRGYTDGWNILMKKR